jgi:hypothetical protein
MKSACKILFSKHEGNTPLGRPSRKWKDNIKIGLEEIGHTV